MKNQSIIVISLISIFIGAAIMYAFVGDDSGFGKYGESSRMSDGRTLKDMESAMPGMHMMPDGTLMGGEGMGMGMDHGSMMVKSEREFLEGMIPHHQEAVDTAKEVLARGGSTPEIKKLANDIVVAQEKEIAMMKEWYQDWYGVAYENNASYQAMMRDLSKLSGAELDKVFLRDMVMHHMGAIMMAESVEPYIKHEEITTLTKAIVETQTKEIQLMRRLYSELE